MALSTSGAGQGNDPIQKANSSINTASLEMDELKLDTSKRITDGAGTSGLLNDISIPETSPITSDYSSYPFASSALPTATTTTTTTATTTKNEMVHPSNQNARHGDQGYTSQEQLTAPTTTNDSTSSAPLTPPPATMTKSEGKAPTTTTAPATSSSSPDTTPQPTRSRLDSDAIGPSTDNPPPAPSSTLDAGPTLMITLLLTSGARHPYKIDEKYLTKRAVAVPGFTENGRVDPLTISVYTLKELILREWRDEWEMKPSSPSSIRLIFFGRLLDDKSALKGEF
ncbi:hypothetical protein SBOR_5792 [Sclerotinia borealis F-4128]|uniref:UBL3-like ubiquitin domain-containing protein n=1 Tax=Sclerotinia borealis (strain F-4128) TaxID=1432307 RepID=W9CAN8_SCLBF|nr:hypothetical protein SBOR_5792 [Sclerotinia borealis F-4128]